MGCSQSQQGSCFVWQVWRKVLRSFLYRAVWRGSCFMVACRPSPIFEIMLSRFAAPIVGLASRRCHHSREARPSLPGKVCHNSRKTR